MWILAIACTDGKDPVTTDTTDTDTTDTTAAPSASVTITVDGETYGLEPNASGGYAIGAGEIVWFTALGQVGLRGFGFTFYVRSASVLAEADYPLGAWEADDPEASLIGFVVADGATGGNTEWTVGEDVASEGALTIEAIDGDTFTFAIAGTFDRAVDGVPDGTSTLEGRAEAVTIAR
jgi:hypothetical protein